MAFPKDIGACVDELYKLRAFRQAAAAKVEKLKESEKELEDHILQTFSKAKLEGARGKVGSCSVSRNVVPTVKDWDKFYAYILKNKAFDLLHKRVSSEAYRARQEEGEVVPGTEPFVIIKLNITKAKK